MSKYISHTAEQIRMFERARGVVEHLAYLESLHNLDAYKGKWGNLHFSKCGKSFMGFAKYASESSALESLREFMAAGACARWHIKFSCGACLQVAGRPDIGFLIYSHAIQIPWRET